MADGPAFRSAVPALPASDVRRAVDFYVDALGFREVSQDDDGLGILARDGVRLHVWLADGSALGAETYLAGSASCRIETTQIETLHEHCAELGVVHPNAPLQDRPWGAREFAVLDPDGNLITFFEWPSG